MFKRTRALVVISALSISLLGALPAFAATKSGPIDPAGSYIQHSPTAFDLCAMTVTDGGGGPTSGAWSDACGHSGIWVLAGRSIAFGCTPASSCGEVVVMTGTLGKKGIGTAKKPGAIADHLSRAAWWAVKV